MNRVSVLGPLSVVLRGVDVPISSTKHRVLLAALVTGDDWSATVDSIADRLWGESQPRNARAAIHVHVARLRRVLDDAVPGGGRMIVSANRGYRLALADDEVDIGQVRALVDRANTARDAGDALGERVSVSTALALWRGSAFEDIESDAVRFADATAFDYLRISLQERLFGIEIALGNHLDVVHDLEAAVAKTPLRESLTAQLMLAHYRSGRQADALEAYRVLSVRLADELGVDPSGDVQNLFRDILNGNPDLLRPPGPEEGQSEPTTWLVSCTLPREHDHLVGRRPEIEDAASSMTTAFGEASSRPAVIVVTGPPGAGKTAFAVHLAHQLREQFPDGQWFTTLDDPDDGAAGVVGVERTGGHLTATTSSVDRMLVELLLSSGVAPEHLPDTRSARSALLRARLTDRQVLIIIDAAETAHHLAALLPGSGRSAVIITSRSSLPGLAVHHDVHTITLGPLPQPDSVQLLHQMLGRSGDGPGTAELIELAELCDHLSLALRIVGAQLRGRSTQFRDSFLARLRSDHVLARLSTDPADGAVSLAATLHTSYTALSDTTRRLLRLMALIPGGGFTVETAAVLLESAELQAAGALDELTRLHLATESDSGATELPELFRQFAAHRSTEVDTAADRRAAIDRLTRWYLTPAADIRLRSPAEIRRHRTTILALIHPDETAPSSPLLVDLAEVACRIFTGHDHDIDWRAAAGHGLRAARELSDHRRAAAFAAALAAAEPVMTLGAPIPSPAEQPALSVSAPAGGPEHHVPTDERAVASADELTGDLHHALERATTIDESDRTARRDEYEPDNLTRIGRILIGLDRLADGHAFHHRALRAARRNHNPYAGAGVHLDLAVAYLLSHRFAEAEQHAKNARALFSSLGDDLGHARATVALGDTYRAARRLDAAERLHESALRQGRRLDNARVVVEASIGLALTYRYLDDRDRALVHGTESALLAGNTGLRLLEGKALGVLAVNNLFARRPRRSKELIDQALSVHEETGHELEKSCVLRWLPAVDEAVDANPHPGVSAIGK
ncbi:BTAD domain-containing putative transcriptional regulator [Rhodococcus jostii]|uniref:BTAD domain-containing putative transcriptional regulator n=1 Tax=Rhodococcus jostii TaxID=132919 RepID=A0ABU4CST7_RHOJO|nr:BTAD domain-containing putative transcriptional regulator [Rhodococcus jostii]MDV6286636.1 BTAD domain-containing putative transcriptional regulator [Rhodococcus jostii]